jgi:DNA-binding NarL/FixJ family response regulator
MTPVAVAVLASDPITQAGAVSLLQAHPDIRLADGHADVLLVMEEHITEVALAEIRTESATHVVLVVEHFRESDLMSLLECGVVAILPRRETGGAELIGAVLNAGDGTANLPPRLQGALLAQVQRMQRDVLEPNGLTLSGLAARECDVLRLVAEGFGTEEIATKLCYSERTVKNVLYGLMTRCGLSNRAHAVAYALRAGAI